MKKIFLFIGLFISLFATAQVDTIKPLQKIFARYEYPNGQKVGGFLVIPNDTPTLKVADSGAIAYLHNTLWKWSGYDWSQAGGSNVIKLNDTVLVVNGDTVKVGGTGSGGKDSINALSGKRKDNIFFSKTPVASSVATFRAIPSTDIDSAFIYNLKIGNRVGQFYFDPFDNYSIDDTATVISATGGGKFKRIIGDYIDPRWFGVKGDGVTDDTYNAQRAVNFGLRNSIAAFVKFDGGTYVINNLVVAMDDDNNGAYNFHSITIEGVAAPFGQSLAGVTIFKVTNPDAFGIGIQSGRNIIIRNIVGLGQAPTVSVYKELVEASDATLLGTARNNRYSPNAFVVIDPFHSSVSSPNRYPGMSAWYFNVSNGGTSMVRMEGLSIYNFAVAVMVSPNGSTQNCDNIVFTGGRISYCRTAWATGQTQSRANLFEKSYMLGGIKYLVLGTEYGAGAGTAPTIEAINAAGSTKYIYWIGGPFEGIAINNSYFESVWSLGKSGNRPVVFNKTHINLNYADGNVFKPAILAEGVYVNINSSTIEYFDQENNGLPFNVDYLSITGENYFSSPIINQRIGGNVTTKGPSTHESILPQSNFNGRVMRNRDTYHNQSADIVYTSLSPDLDAAFIESKMVDVDSVNATAYFVSTLPSRYQVGDCLISHRNQDDPNDIYSLAQTTMGNVYAISGDTVKLKNIPSSLAEGVSHEVYVIHRPLFINRTYGDVTSGSDTIRNVKYVSNSFRVGDFIKGTGIPDGARVKYVNLGAEKIALTVNASATNTKVALYDAVLTMEVRGNFSSGGTRYDNQVFFKGDIIRNGLTANDSVAYWLCTSPGAYNTDHAPTFKSVRAGDGPVKNIANSDLTLTGDRFIEGAELNFEWRNFGDIYMLPKRQWIGGSQLTKINGSIVYDPVYASASADLDMYGGSHVHLPALVSDRLIIFDNLYNKENGRELVFYNLNDNDTATWNFDEEVYDYDGNVIELLPNLSTTTLTRLNNTWVVTSVTKSTPGGVGGGDVDLSSPQTLSNKTLASPKINLGGDSTNDLIKRNSSGGLSPFHVGPEGTVIKSVGGDWVPGADELLNISPGTGISISPGTGLAGDPRVISATGPPGSNPLKALTIESFGGLADYTFSGTTMLGTNNSVPLQAMIDAAADMQLIVIPNGNWYFASKITIPKTKRINLICYGNVYCPNGLIQFAAINQRKHSLIFAGNAVGRLGLQGDARTDFDNSTGMYGVSGVTYSTLNASGATFIDINDCTQTFIAVNDAQGFKAVVKFIAGSVEFAGNQEVTVQLGWLRKNYYGVWFTNNLQAYNDKNVITGWNGGTGRIGGYQSIFFDGGAEEKHTATSNIIQNILFEACGYGAKATGNCIYTKFIGCHWEGGSNTGCWSKEYINFKNTAISGGRTPSMTSLIGCEYVFLDWLTNIGFYFTISATPIWVANPADRTQQVPIAMNAIGGTSGKTTIIGTNSISSTNKSWIPSNIDYILYTNTPSPTTDAMVVRDGATGTERIVKYGSGSGGSTPWIDDAGNIRYPNKATLGGTGATARLDLRPYNTPSDPFSGLLRLWKQTRLTTPPNGSIQNDDGDLLFTENGITSSILHTGNLNQFRGQLQGEMIVIDANYTITQSINTVVVPATSTRVVTLPPAADFANREITIVNATSGSSFVNLSIPVKETASTVVTAMIAGAKWTIKSDGTNWWLINKS